MEYYSEYVEKICENLNVRQRCDVLILAEQLIAHTPTGGLIRTIDGYFVNDIEMLPDSDFPPLYDNVSTEQMMVRRISERINKLRNDTREQVDPLLGKEV